MHDPKRLHKLCLEGDEVAERRLYQYLRRKISYPTGGQTAHVDQLKQPICIGDYVVYSNYSDKEIGLVVGSSKERIRVVFKRRHPRLWREGQKKIRESSINPQNCVAFPPQAVEGRIWSEFLQEYREKMFSEEK